MLKTLMPSVVLGLFLAGAMLVSPMLSIETTPAGTLLSAASTDPFSPIFVSPHAEKDVLETHPKSPAAEGESAYATLEVAPETSGEPSPVVRASYREFAPSAEFPGGDGFEALLMRREEPSG